MGVSPMSNTGVSPVRLTAVPAVVLRQRTGRMPVRLTAETAVLR